MAYNRISKEFIDPSIIAQLNDAMDRIEVLETFISDLGNFVNESGVDKFLFNRTAELSTSWDADNLLRIGTSRLWVDSDDNLRIKNGVPDSDKDGIVVGRQF